MDVKVAKRRLKKPCAHCGKPVLKGQKYLTWRRHTSTGWFYGVLHYECYLKRGERNSRGEVNG